jgi:hypothetical protein
MWGCVFEFVVPEFSKDRLSLLQDSVTEKFSFHFLVLDKECNHVVLTHSVTTEDKDAIDL